MTRVFRSGGGTVIKNKRDGYIPPSLSLLYQISLFMTIFLKI